MTQQLYRLPDGTWITLSEITRIHVFSDKYGSGIGVAVSFAAAAYTTLPFESLTAAHDYVDQLAALVNKEAS